MITVFIGSVNSNKSVEAENYMQSLDGKSYYLATMRADSDIRKDKIERLRKRREDKGFVTIEQDVAIVKAIDKIKWMDMLLGADGLKKNLLIENIPYLAANELFANRNKDDNTDTDQCITVKEAESTILCGLALLVEFFNDIVIVTDSNADLQYYGDGTEYTVEETDRYMELMKELNTAVSSYAEDIIELT